MKYRSYLFATFLLLALLACKETESKRSVSSFKSTSPFVIELESTHQSHPSGHVYLVTARALAAKNIEKISSRWQFGEGVQVVSESPVRFEKGTWITSVEILSSMEDPPGVVEFVGESEGTPLGNSSVVSYDHGSVGPDGKTVDDKRGKLPSLFPERTQF